MRWLLYIYTASSDASVRLSKICRGVEAVAVKMVVSRYIFRAGENLRRQRYLFNLAVV